MNVVLWLATLLAIYSVIDQGTTKVLSDSPGLVEWLVGLGRSYRTCSLPNWQALLVSLF